MPVEKTEGGFVVTGKDITLFSWIALRGAVSVEIKTGMGHSGGRSASSIAISRLGLPGRPRKATVLKALDAKIAELKAAR